MAGCELFIVFKRINPDFTCKKDCGSSPECDADLEKYVPEISVPESREVGVYAFYNAETVPLKH